MTIASKQFRRHYRACRPQPYATELQIPVVSASQSAFEDFVNQHNLAHECVRWRNPSEVPAALGGRTVICLPGWGLDKTAKLVQQAARLAGATFFMPSIAVARDGAVKASQIRSCQHIPDYTGPSS